MLSLRTTARKALLVSTSSIVLMAATSGFAEVGVMNGIGAPPNSYILQSITDDPEPIDSLWQVYSPTGGNHVVLNADGAVNGDGRPSLLTSPLGVPVVAWPKNLPSGFDLVVSRFENGAWTTPQVIAADPADELDPVLFIDPTDDSIHLVYWVNEAVPRVLHREAPADLSSWSAPVQISRPGEVAVRPSGVFHQGRMRIVYEVHDLGLGSTPRQIILMTDAAGQFNWVTLHVNLYDGENRPEVHSKNGRMWVDWLESEGEACWTRSLNPNLWEPTETELFSGMEEREFHVRGRIKSLAID